MTDKSVSIVLVHGGFVDGSGWQGVHDILTADGYEVLSKGMPYTTDEIEKIMSQKSIIEAVDERR